MPPDRRGAANPDNPTTHDIADGSRATSWRAFTSPEHLGEVGSTNTELLVRAAEGAPEGTVLVADTQTKGRGRLGRRWVDRPGSSLLCSLLFRPKTPEDAPLAPLTVSLAALDACRLAGAPAALKWPNDLVERHGGDKFGGVLSEVGRDGAVVVGIGINVAWPAEEPMPAGATCLDCLVGRPVDRERLLAEFLEGVSRRWALLRPGRPDRDSAVEMAHGEYAAACATIGQDVRVQLAGEELTGRATGVDGSGRLVVDTTKDRRVVSAGDVVHLRPRRESAGD